MQGKENFYRKKTSIWSSKTLQEIDNEVHEMKEKQVGRTTSLWARRQQWSVKTTNGEAPGFQPHLE